MVSVAEKPDVLAGGDTHHVQLLFSANECLDIGTALGRPVSLDCYDRAPPLWLAPWFDTNVVEPMDDH